MTSPQLALDLAAPRRLDVAIERLAASIAAASPWDRQRLAQTPQWGVLDMVVAMRAMERAEQQATGRRSADSVADVYDRCAVPGPHRQPQIEEPAR